MPAASLPRGAPSDPKSPGAFMPQWCTIALPLSLQLGAQGLCGPRTPRACHLHTPKHLFGPASTGNLEGPW